MNNNNTEKRSKEKVKGIRYYLSEICDSYFMFVQTGVMIFALAGLIYANSVPENLNDKLTADLKHHGIEEDLGITTEEAKEYTLRTDNQIYIVLSWQQVFLIRRRSQSYRTGNTTSRNGSYGKYFSKTQGNASKESGKTKELPSASPDHRLEQSRKLMCDLWRFCSV